MMNDDLLDTAPLADEPSLDLPAGDLEGEAAPFKSIDEEMVEIVDSIEAREKGEQKETPAGEKPRAPDGKFAKVEQKAPDAKVDPKAFTDHGPPSTWRAGAKAQWDNVPPELKAEIYKRENDALNGITQYQAKAQVADNLVGIIAPYKGMIDAVGSDVPTALNELFRVASVLNFGTPKAKIDTLRQIVQQHGIDLSSLAGNTGGDQFVDPGMQALQTEVAQLRSFLTQQQQAAQNSEVSSAWGEMQRFGSNPENRYFEDVRGHMGRLIQAGLVSGATTSEVLRNAYEQACKLHPQVAAAREIELRQAQDAKANEERAKRAQSARRAASVGVSSSPSHGPMMGKTGSIDDTMMAVYEKLQSAA